jgi:hypothetical protein
VSWLYKSDAVQRLGENTFLYDLSKIRGTSAILNRIPDNMSGVYAWYRNFQLNASAIDSSEVFVSSILSELFKPHCVTRETRLPPSHRLILKSETVLSRQKQEALKYYADNSNFRELLVTLLSNCLLFQQPLYIGKAINLKNRIRNHLNIESLLRERLKEAEHDIEKCRLLILGCPENLDYLTSENIDTEEEQESEISQLAPEALIEDILSRLFLPSLLTKSTATDAQDSLPLSLVRWQDDVNKFDNSYYLNSLVHLDLLVKALLDLNEPKDPMDDKQIKTFIKDINETLGIDGKEVEHEERTLTQYYIEDCCDEDGNPQTPFSRLPEYYLESAIKGFEQNFRPWVIKLLMDFKPYSNLLKYARTKNLIEGTFGQFQAQTSKHKSMIKEQEIAKDNDWYNKEIVTPQNAIADMKDNQWAFKAIFQKAIVRLGKIVEFDHKGKDKNLGTIKNVLLFLDNLYERKILEVRRDIPELPLSLWTFIALNPGNQKIKVNKTVEDRIFSILLLWYYGNRKLLQDKQIGKPQSTRRELLKFFRGEVNKAEWASCTDAYKALEKGFNITTFYPFYGKGKEEISKEKQQNLVREHFSKVLAVGIPDLANQVDDLSIDDEEID